MVLPALPRSRLCDGPLNVAPELWMAIWNAYAGGRLREAEGTAVWDFVDRMLRAVEPITLWLRRTGNAFGN